MPFPDYIANALLDLRELLLDRELTLTSLSTEEVKKFTRAIGRITDEGVPPNEAFEFTARRGRPKDKWLPRRQRALAAGVARFKDLHPNLTNEQAFREIADSARLFRREDALFNLLFIGVDDVDKNDVRQLRVAVQASDVRSVR